MRSLERLDVFLLSRELAVRVYKMTRTRPLCEHGILAAQIARAMVSIPANIAEGYGLGTAGQLIRCLRIAYGSSLELDTHPWIAQRVGALSPSPHATRAIADLARVTQMLGGF